MEQRRGEQVPVGLSLGWTLLQGIADLGEHDTLDKATRKGQLTSIELIDHYKIEHPQIREVFRRYLDERRPSLDYGSWAGMAATLMGAFWYDIQVHEPDQVSLHVPHEMIEAWKLRLRTTPTRLGTPRSDAHYFSILITVRAFYRDLQEWALQDPSWAQWNFPNPIRKSDTAGTAKADRKRAAVINQRIRERLPQLPVLVDTAERHRREQAALLSVTKQCALGATFEHRGRGYRRITPLPFYDSRSALDTPLDVVEDLATGKAVPIGREENDAFWAWAAIEVLRHTGVRIEELVEITHLALVAYRLPATGEVVPMLQIVPSKNNEERLLLVSPELASVLASIITRLRAENGGSVPLATRYDHLEKVTGPPLPHLFQRRHGWTWKSITYGRVQKLLEDTLARTGLTDAVGRPLRYTPHDFRRLWATDAVSNGLPIHIAAKLLGHKSINTTQIYVAVFDEHLVRSYRGFLDNRRALRPEAEYREPTEHEWREFQKHFELRQLELGTCARPYGSPCRHEHACIRCPSLRVDPRARDRLAEITANLRDRIAEAKVNGWTGEVEGLRVSLAAAAAKLASLDTLRQRTTATASLTDLGLPAISAPAPP